LNKGIILKDVIKYYGITPAINEITLNINEGEWVSIMGPSGSGKTTLLNLIGGLDRPTSGEIWIDGVNLNEMDEDGLAALRRESIGFVFQQYHLIPYLTAVENVMLAQYIHSVPDRDEAIESLKRVGMGHRVDHLPSELSGGEKQRVSIARAIINNPKILLADEPTGNLDRKNSIIVLDILKTLYNENNFTIIMVTHDPLIAKWGKRIINIEDGRIIKDERILNR
jgi:putative ABC transport system ATP-binding protein